MTNITVRVDVFDVPASLAHLFGLGLELYAAPPPSQVPWVILEEH